MISTVGAFMFAAGVVLFVDRHGPQLRPPDEARAILGGPARWSGCPTASYAVRSIPVIRSRDPLWDQPELAERGRGRPLLPARHRHRRARDDRHQPGRDAAAICDAPARPRLGPCARRHVHRRLLPAADGQALSPRGGHAACWPCCSCCAGCGRSIRPGAAPRSTSATASACRCRHRGGLAQRLGGGGADLRRRLRSSPPCCSPTSSCGR